MNVVGRPLKDGTVQVHCPRPGCSAVLRIKPRADRSWVTCAAEGCRHRFILEVSKSDVASASVPDALTFATSATPDHDAPPARTRPRGGSAGRKRPPEKAKNGAGAIALVVGGGLAALLLVGGLIAVGVAYFTRDRDGDRPALGPIVQAEGPAHPVVPLAFVDPVPAKVTPVAQSNPASTAPPVAPAKADPVATSPASPAKTESDEPDDDDPEPAAGGPAKKGPRKKGPAPRSTGGVAADAIETVKKSTALIERKDGWGTGFVIRPQIVMTNFHVISGAMLDELKVSFVSLNETAPVPLKPTLLYCNPERDIAIFRVDTDRPPLDMCPTGTQLTGLEVAVVGNPRGDGGQAVINKVTTGRLAAPVRRNASWTYYELQAEAFFGNSGGPVVDRKTGKLVGVMQSILGDGKTKSYCIPFGEATKALDRLPASTADEPKATRVASARHYLDYFRKEVQIIEDNAVLAMDIRLFTLRDKASPFGPSGVSVINRRTGQTYSAAEVMTQLKEQHAKMYTQLSRLVEGYVRASPEVPSSLTSVARLRLQTCGAMRALAGGSTETETRFRQLMDNRRSNNEKAARDFEEAYKKFLDGLDAPPSK